MEEITKYLLLNKKINKLPFHVPQYWHTHVWHLFVPKYNFLERLIRYLFHPCYKFERSKGTRLLQHAR